MTLVEAIPSSHPSLRALSRRRGGKGWEGSKHAESGLQGRAGQVKPGAVSGRSVGRAVGCVMAPFGAANGPVFYSSGWVYLYTVPEG